MIACNWQPMRSKYRRIENRLYRYAEIDETIAELEEKLEDLKPSQTTSFIMFGVTGGQLPSSVQERFYMRKDVEMIMGKISFLVAERAKIGEAVKMLTLQERETFDMCFVYNLQPNNVKRILGVDRTTLFRRRQKLVCKMQQNLT